MLFSQSDSLVLLAATMSEMNEGQACGHSWCGRGGRRLSTRRQRLRPLRRRLACLTICTSTMLILFMKILSERKSSSLLERWMTRLTTNALIPAHCGVETACGSGWAPHPTHFLT